MRGAASARLTPAQAEREKDIARRIGPGQQCRVLEDIADIAGPRLPSGLPGDAPVAGALQPGQQPQQGRLAAAGRAEKGDEFPGADLGGNAVQRAQPVRKGLADRMEGEHYFFRPKP